MIKDSKVLNFNVRNRFEKNWHTPGCRYLPYFQKQTQTYFYREKNGFSWTTIKGITLIHLTIRAIESNDF